MTAAAGVAAGSLIGGIMIAGAAFSAVGAITGNKKLSRIGGVLSLAGGIAGAVSGAWSTAAGEVAGEAATEGVGAAVGDVAQDVALEQAGAEVGSTVAGDLANAAGDAANTAAGGVSSGLDAATAATSTLDPSILAQGNVAGLEGGVAPNAGSGLLGQTTPIQDAVSNLAPSGVVGDTAGQAAASSIQPTSVAQVPTAGGAAVPPVPAAEPSAIQSALKWVQEPGNARLVQAGSGLLSSGMKAYGQQEAIKTQIKLQEEALQRSRDRLNASVKGLRVPTYKAPTPATRG